MFTNDDMKTYSIFAIGGTVTGSTVLLVQNDIQYYVYDEIDNSIELWNGSDLRNTMNDESLPPMSFKWLSITVGTMIAIENTLILANNGVHRYIWYDGELAIHGASGQLMLKSVNPTKVRCTSDAASRQVQKLDYKSTLRRISMDI